MLASQRGKFAPRHPSRCWSRIGITIFAAALFLLHVSPALAVDEVEGGSTGNLDVFQLDGADSAAANADTCVGSESQPCSSTAEENPSWPADWDAMVNPSLAARKCSGGTNDGNVCTSDSGCPGGTCPLDTLSGFGLPGAAGTFATPWGPAGTFSGIFTSTFVNSTSTILKQGSKNSNDISTWVVAQQNSPPKDAIVAAAIATFTGPTGSGYDNDELLYNAVTRFSSNGSSTLGIWLFLQNVQVCTSGPNIGKALCVGNTSTPARHQPGDLFLFITFGGSGFANIQVAEWLGGVGSAGSLQDVTKNVVVCPTANDDLCEVTNQTNITLGAPLHGGKTFQEPGYGFNVAGSNFAGFPNGAIPALQFQEGGIDLNRVLGGAPPCFSTVMFASVSSGSSPATASLKAILFGSVNACQIGVTKTCGTPTFSAPNLTYPIYGAITNTGNGSVSNFSISDSPALDSAAKCYIPGNGNDALPCNGNAQTTYASCSSASALPGATVCYQGTFTSSSRNGGSDTIMVGASGTGGGTAECADGSTPPCSASATCPTFSENLSIAVTKTCTAYVVPTGSGLEVEVDASGTVTNTIPQACSNSSGAACTTDADCTTAGEDCNTGTGVCYLPCTTNADCGTGNTCNPPSTTKLDTLKNVSVTDSANGKTITIGSLAPGASAPYAYTYNPLTLGVCAGGTNAGKACAKSTDCPGGTCGVTPFTDTVTATGTCNDSLVCGTKTVSDDASASCPLCPVNVK